MSFMDTLVTLARQTFTQFKEAPLGRQILYGVGAYVGLVTAYVIYFRIREKSKPFNAYSTAEDAINNKDLKGKTAVITGCNSGIGKETVRVLAKQGCTVVMACRNVKKAGAAKEEIVNALSEQKDVAERVIVMPLDVSSLQSVYDFAVAFSKRKLRIDYLINNAGIMALPTYATTKDGFEMQFGTNHLGHWYLAELLMPMLRASKKETGVKPRVINIASWGHGFAPFNRVDPLFDYCIQNKCFMGEKKKEYGDFYNYGISKMANILHARGLSKRYGEDIIPVSVHPGAINTNLSVHMDPKSLVLFIPQLLRPSFYTWEVKTVPQGAATTVRCVSMTDEEIHPGGYHVNCNHYDTLLTQAAKKDLEDGLLADKLWELSGLLVKEKNFPLALQ